MGEAGFKPALPYIEKLSGRKEHGRIYIKGDFQEKSLGEWAKEAIVKLKLRKGISKVIAICHPERSEGSRF